VEIVKQHPSGGMVSGLSRRLGFDEDWGRAGTIRGDEYRRLTMLEMSE
jgi:hypothetical protein